MNTARSVESVLDDVLNSSRKDSQKTLFESSNVLDRNIRRKRKEKKAKESGKKEKFSDIKWSNIPSHDDFSVSSALTYGSSGGDGFDASYQDDVEWNMSSNRSWGSAGSFGTVNSQVSLLTSRELVHKIEESARRGRPRPVFVPSLQELPQTKITWNGELLRIKKSMVPKQTMANEWSQRQRVINIIGCHQPIELLLAKADERVRKQKKSMTRREKGAKMQREHLKDVLNKKYSRAERYNNILRFKQLQCGWMKTIVQIRWYMALKAKGEILVKAVHQHRAAKIIQTAFRHYKLLMIFRQMARFRQAVPDLSRIRMRLRILRKRIAVRVLTANLKDYKNKDNVSLIIHRFLYAVRKVQRILKSFVVCKKARMRLIYRRWHRLELQYIKDQQELKAKLQRNGGRKLLSIESLPIDEETKIRMGKQQAKFDMAEEAISEAVKVQQQTGLLSKKDRRVQMSKLCIPIDVLAPLIRNIVEQKRKEFMIRQVERAIRMQQSLLDFKPEDALALLMVEGAADDIAKRVQRATIRFQPFLCHKDIKDDSILDLIKEQHAIKGTFVASTKEVSELEKRRRMLQDEADNQEKIEAEAEKKVREEYGRKVAAETRGGVTETKKKKRIKRSGGEVQGKQKLDGMTKGITSPERNLKRQTYSKTER